MIELTLPYPPSTNHYWRHLSRGPLAGRVLVSEAGRAYRAAVEAHVLSLGLHRKRLATRLSVTLGVRPPDRRRRDLDNVLKASLDALSHAGLIADDSLIDDLRVLRGEPIAGGALRVLIAPYAPEVAWSTWKEGGR